MTLIRHSCKEFTKSGIITLPSHWRDSFGYLVGTSVEVCMNNRKRIVIKKPSPNSVENQRLLVDGGKIMIPKELREIAHISPKDEYCMIVDTKRKQFILSLLS